uniref:Uncharacterized protein n=1 Tax=Chelonoidis abingdonii TaxID=106734 RepID=A0A8C0INA0_CHEAB
MLWGAGLLQTLPLAQTYVQDAGVDTQPNLDAWGYFPQKWPQVRLGVPGAGWYVGKEGGSDPTRGRAGVPGMGGGWESGHRTPGGQSWGTRCRSGDGKGGTEPPGAEQGCQAQGGGWERGLRPNEGQSKGARCRAGVGKGGTDPPGAKQGCQARAGDGKGGTEPPEGRAGVPGAGQGMGKGAQNPWGAEQGYQAQGGGWERGHRLPGGRAGVPGAGQGMGKGAQTPRGQSRGARRRAGDGKGGDGKGGTDSPGAEQGCQVQGGRWERGVRPEESEGAGLLLGEGCPGGGAAKGLWLLVGGCGSWQRGAREGAELLGGRCPGGGGAAPSRGVPGRGWVPSRDPPADTHPLLQWGGGWILKTSWS